MMNMRFKKYHSVFHILFFVRLTKETVESATQEKLNLAIITIN